MKSTPPWFISHTAAFLAYEPSTYTKSNQLYLENQLLERVKDRWLERERERKREKEMRASIFPIVCSYSQQSPPPMLGTGPG